MYPRQPEINYVGFGAMRRAAGTVRNFQLVGGPVSVELAGAKTFVTLAPVDTSLPCLGGPSFSAKGH